MKHRILTLTAISLFVACAINLTVTSVAQNIGDLAKQAGSLGADNISALTQALHLNPGQMQQVLPILQQELPKLQAIRGNAKLSDKQKVSQAKTVQQQSDSKLKPILSPQQFLSLKNFRSQQLQQIVGGAIPH